MPALRVTGGPWLMALTLCAITTPVNSATRTRSAVWPRRGPWRRHRFLSERSSGPASRAGSGSGRGLGLGVIAREPCVVYRSRWISLLCVCPRIGPRDPGQDLTIAGDRRGMPAQLLPALGTPWAAL